MQYRRYRHHGGCFFFTVNLAQRNQSLLTEQVDGLRACMKKVQQTHPFVVEAIVILPDHLHAIWTLPPEDHDYAKRWMLIKSGFSRMLPKNERVNPSRVKKRERGIWQRRYWEHYIRDDIDFERHINYIHFNPVKHGYVSRPIDWRYSSIHRFINAGIIDCHWGRDINGETSMAYGEW
jgi:REP-associated tyrosine transposase